MEKQEFINKLVYRNDHSFKQVGPNTLFFHDDIDTVIIFFAGDEVVITHDGIDVVVKYDAYNMVDKYWYPHGDWEKVYQEVLDLF